MEPAVHQSLINDIETLLADDRGIDETIAKNFRKTAESLIAEHAEHPLRSSLEQCLEQLRTRIHEQVQKRDADFDRVMESLDRAVQALKAEKLKDAEDATHRALSIAGQIPGLSRQRHDEIEKKLDGIYPRMRKLSAWRHWGTTRAREDLIDQIKQIPGSQMDPNQIVKTLRAAKAQWQDWEKSGDHSEHALWKEFSDACDAAYEPCRAYFKEQKELRKQHRTEKRELIDSINQKFAETDWHHPDWKELDKWLRQARGRFFKIGHTDYKHHKKLRADLDQALAQFEPQLERERERNLKLRRKLISDIEALADIEDSREAMSRMEQLKKQWITTVLDKRGVENKLWKQYQAAQDQVYGRRKSERRQQDNERLDNLKQKLELVEELTRAADAPDQALLAGQSLLAQFRDRFNAIGYVPRKDEKSLLDRWRKAQKDYATAVKKAEQTQARSSQEALLQKARLCAELELKKNLGETIDPELAKADYHKLPTLADDLEQALQARLQAALDDSVYDPSELSSNTETQLQRCLKAEVIQDLPTPDQYARQRMAYQIERLSNSMKKSTGALESIDTLKQDLLVSGPVDATEQPSIWARIDNIINT